MVLDEERKSNEQPVPQSGAGEYIIGGALMGAMLLLVLGITPVGITAIASDSMHPTFGKGSGVITLKVKEDKLKEGDIISFTKDNKTVIHRINKVEKEDKEIRYYTKGDANNTVDDGYITYEDINNKVLFSIPLIGYPAIIISDIFSK
jgi:signal peptidase I